MFEHVLLFLSFVYAIAITHLLSSANELIQARRRLRVSGLLIAWMVAALELLVINWLAAAGLASVKHWTMAAVLRDFGTTILQYFTCAFVAMRVPEEGEVDMPAYLEAQRVPILLAFLSLAGAAAVGNFIEGDQAWVAEDAQMAISVMPAVAALFFRARWLQWLAVLVLLASGALFLVQFIAVS